MDNKPKSIIDIDIEINDTPLDVSLPDDDHGTFTLPGVDEAPIITNMPKQVLNLESIEVCPRCSKPLVNAIAIDGNESNTFKECPECGTLINTYKPTYYQAIFLRRPEIYKMGAGGYGTGKSRMNIEDVIKHLLLIPRARVGVTARSYPALEATFIKEFYSMFPAKLVRKKNDQKHELTLTNGSELLFRSFDDSTKFKSMNLTMGLMIEASDLLYGDFNMLQSRIRNTNAMIPEYDANGEVVRQWDVGTKTYKIKYAHDARHISLETNPDGGWVKTKFLLDAATVDFFGDAYNEGYKFAKERDKHKYVQVVSTSANPYLPATYEEEQTRGKSKAYIQQFYKGSFNFSSNLVFPNVGVVIKPPGKLPPEFDDDGRRTLWWNISLDYGVNDPTHIIYSAFSTITKKLYVFAELRIFSSDVKTIVKEHRKAIREYGIDVNGLIMLPRFDGRSHNKRESDLRQIGENFNNEGLFFEPAFHGHDIRIIKLNAMINHEQIEIWSTCEFVIEELLNYKWVLDKEGNPTNKPKDGNDHGVTALEFGVVDLPHNLKELNLGVYIPSGTRYIHDKLANVVKKKKDPVWDPLTEDKNDRNNFGFTYNINYTGSNSIGLSNPIHDEGAIVDGEDADDENYNRTLQSYIPGRY